MKNDINELKEFANQVWKDMPKEYKRTMFLGSTSTIISLSSLLMSGTAKKLAAGVGIATYVATLISALDANKKLLDSIDATTEKINANWEEYKASHPEIFGNN